jgi:hypothetical protein
VPTTVRDVSTNFVLPNFAARLLSSLAVRVTLLLLTAVAPSTRTDEAPRRAIVESAMVYLFAPELLRASMALASVTLACW